jgi:hypothetical protein
MKIILTESQFNRILSEQVKATLTPSNQSNQSSSLKPTMNVASGTINPTKGSMPVDPHTLMTILAIGTAFIPVAGPFISAGIGLVDAALYYKEGDKTSAGVTAAFSMIPFIGKIPGVKEFGSKAMAALGSKVAKGIKVFTPDETKILNVIKQNESLVKQGLESASKKLPTIAKDLQSFKPAYIERFGQESYDNLLREFLSGKSDKEYFVGVLRDGTKASPNLANFVTKFGIKFAKDEVSQIQKLASELMEVNTTKNIIITTKEGTKTIKVHMVPKNMVQKYFPASAEANMFADAAGGNVFMVKDNVKNLSSKQIEDVLTHEFAHIKDPSLVASPKFIKKYSTEAIQGIEDYVQSTQLKNLGFEAKATEKMNSAIKKYYLNPNEIIANNTMVLQSFASTTKSLSKVMNKNQILKGLDDVINFAKGSSSKLSDDAYRLLGYYDTNISNHFQNMATNPAEYRKLLAKLAQQAAYLKSQVKIAM